MKTNNALSLRPPLLSCDSKTRAEAISFYHQLFTNDCPAHAACHRAGSASDRSTLFTVIPAKVALPRQGGGNPKRLAPGFMPAGYFRTNNCFAIAAFCSDTDLMFASGEPLFVSS
jgi:hypothetical protein